ncbi:chromosome partitioning protein [Candidatus Competibacter denitrificans Run_A_D11]|jgi:ParB family chromosome partitioning protein|uniref:Probable chromosome-partitioning protein ParB n=1 Tax=Candidatus Competibacter denitrificans Run_A_D11 TaxID=1400863 RepID=W6M616_9GAMM|nr:ParB/RepB/Spo0J family partition protein [Candidatus Competibacter denitrificans]CDI01195.1 chromosome partitioning protein [Candidatus Competibacter denitrificans Run_A_D11]HRC70640.1 ParB/RepB/Spo0J family partition protein [Candidatus Competibacter denitrificans]
MIRKKGGLGRGLDALLGAGLTAASRSEAPAEPVFSETLRPLPVEHIVKGRYQPRQTLQEDSLHELADSIRAQGLVQPIVVRPLGGEHYELIAGERRWRAAQLAGLSEIPAIVREVPDQAAIAMALIENIQREDLNPLEEAVALRRLIAEFALTHQQAAEAIGRSRTSVTNLLRLLDLTEDVQRLVHERKLEMGHARALLPLPADLQREAAHQVLLRGLSARETEDLVRRLLKQEALTPPREKPLDPNIRSLQDDLSERLGARVQLRQETSGKGRMVVHYNSLDELDGIIARMK